MTNLERALAFIQAIETNGDVEKFYAPDVVHQEFPNRIAPQGHTRDLSGLREAMAKGREILARQKYEIVTSTCEGDRVVLEAIWKGELKSGHQLSARFAQVIEFENGLIKRQRNYDCFDPAPP